MKRLTNELIESNTRLDERQKSLLRGFIEAFPGSTVQCISKEESERRKESSIPANGDTSTNDQLSMKTNQPTRQRPAWRAQAAKLFQQKEPLNEHNDSTNR